VQEPALAAGEVGDRRVFARWKLAAEVPAVRFSPPSGRARIEILPRVLPVAPIASENGLSDLDSGIPAHVGSPVTPTL
jgi:hypothetical protein